MPDLEEMVQDIQRNRARIDSDIPNPTMRTEIEQLFELLASMENDYWATSGRKPQAYLIGGRWWHYLTEGRGSYISRRYFFRSCPIHHVELPGLQTLAGVAE